MDAKFNAYLLETAFGPGEFERSQVQFEEASATLGAILSTHVADVMRSNLSKDIADEWVTAANEVLELMMVQTPSDQESQRVALEMQHALQAKPRLSDSTIEAEIQSFGDESAQLVLARWYAELHSLSIPVEGVPLNANMLPGTRSIEAILETLDFGAFGVTHATVALAVRAYRELLVAQAGDGVIAFAPQLFLLFNASNIDQPFRCFKSIEDAESAQRARAPVAKAAVEECTGTPIWRYGKERRSQLVRILEAVRRATLPSSDETGVDIGILVNAVAFLLDEMPARTLPGLSHWQPTCASTYFRGVAGAEKLLQESVGLGVDIFSAGMSSNLYEARHILSSRSAPIRDLLFLYANERDVKVGAAADIYAISVAAGVACQFRHFGGGSQGAADPGARAGLMQAFKHKHGVSSRAASLLLSDSQAGTAYIACPLG